MQVLSQLFLTLLPFPPGRGQNNARSFSFEADDADSSPHRYEPGRPAIAEEIPSPGRSPPTPFRSVFRDLVTGIAEPSWLDQAASAL